MHVVRTIEELRARRAELPGRVVFVPTMGALHDGHVSLMKLGLEHADHLIVSIFVNPTQFAPNEDLDEYPRDEQGDRDRCEEAGCEILFMPTPDVIYPAGGNTQPTVVAVESMTRNLCGRSRPTHFAGVTTVVTKLFNMVDPDVAVFGAKDYQQLAVLKQMTKDLNFDIEVIGGPTHREVDGVARSSRNRNILPEFRDSAVALSRALAAAWAAYRDGERSGTELEALARSVMQSYNGVDIDYVECVHPETLAPLSGSDADPIGEDGAVLAVAARLGPVRLIDNLRLDGPLPEEIPEP